MRTFNRKKRKNDNNTVNGKYQTVYWKVKLPDAEKRLDVIIQDKGEGIPIGQIMWDAQLESGGQYDKQIKNTKEKVFDDNVECINGEGYQTESKDKFNKVNIADVVLLIIFQILTAFRLEVSHNLCLQSVREIIAEDKQMASFQDLEGIDYVWISEL